MPKPMMMRPHSSTLKELAMIMQTVPRMNSVAAVPIVACGKNNC